VQHVHVYKNKYYIPDQDKFVHVVLISFVYQIHLVMFRDVENFDY
jgi:hypothetical protein